MASSSSSLPPIPPLPALPSRATSSSSGGGGFASAPSEVLRPSRGMHSACRFSDEEGRSSSSESALFRQKVGFLGLLCVAFTGAVYLMTKLKTVLEPFMWALFLVIAMQPIATFIEEILIWVGRTVCGCLSRCCALCAGARSADLGGARRPRLSRSPPPRARRCPLRAEDDPEIELRQAAAADDEELHDELPPGAAGAGAGGGAGGAGAADGAAGVRFAPERSFPSFSPPGRSPGSSPGYSPGYSPRYDDLDLWDAPRIEGICGSCCETLSRIIAVTGALAVVLGLFVAMAMPVVEGAVRLQENSDIYEQGVRNAIANVKRFFTTTFKQVPKTVLEQISDSVLLSAKTIGSELLAKLAEYGGIILVELLMLALYVMFWLCTPMPLNTKTERIFRRYLALKGASCLCYGLCVGLMLRGLKVECAVPFGMISFFFSFIPEVGAFLAMSLPVPVILFDSRLEKPWLTLSIATAGQLGLKFLFANIIEVKLVENDSTMKMHPVVTLLAVTFFGVIWGPTGMLLSVPIMTYFKIVVLSDRVPSAYRDPVLVMIEGDRRAPERHRRRRLQSAAARELAGASASAPASVSASVGVASSGEARRRAAASAAAASSAPAASSGREWRGHERPD